MSRCTYRVALGGAVVISKGASCSNGLAKTRSHNPRPSAPPPAGRNRLPKRPAMSSSRPSRGSARASPTAAMMAAASMRPPAKSWRPNSGWFIAPSAPSPGLLARCLVRRARRRRPLRRTRRRRRVRPLGPARGVPPRRLRRAVPPDGGCCGAHAPQLPLFPAIKSSGGAQSCVPSTLIQPGLRY